jgi:hypothetical protein
MLLASGILPVAPLSVINTIFNYRKIINGIET